MLVLKCSGLTVHYTRVLTYWYFSGKHTYLHLIIHLDDYCARGKAWKIWKNMEIIDASKPDEFYDGGDLSWLDFQGAWGNIQTIVS